jgi:hypothetical protein
MPYDNDTTYEFSIDGQDAEYCEEYGLNVIYWKAIAAVRCTEMQLRQALGLV